MSYLKTLKKIRDAKSFFALYKSFNPDGKKILKNKYYHVKLLGSQIFVIMGIFKRKYKMNDTKEANFLYYIFKQFIPDDNIKIKENEVYEAELEGNTILGLFHLSLYKFEDLKVKKFRKMMEFQKNVS